MYEQHIIVDFEMNPVSGKNSKTHSGLRKEIIEIGAVKLNRQNIIVDRFTCLVKPQYNSDITQFITELTGIKNDSVRKACDFKTAVSKFSEWIGEKKTRIYSWSDTDLIQLQQECAYKQVKFPDNMKRWMDFQAVYPKVMELETTKRMSLMDAAQWYGLCLDKRKAHRAMYDAEITADLVISVLTGDYKKQVELLRETKRTDGKVCFTLGDICGGILSQLKVQTDTAMEFSR